MKKYSVIFILTILSMVFITSSNSDIKTVKFNEKVIFENMTVDQFLTTDSQNNHLSNEEVLVQLKFNYDYTYNNHPTNLVTNEEVEQYKQNLRRSGAMYHQTRNAQYLSDLEINDYDNLYVSKYSPFVEFTMDYEDLSSDNFNMIVELQENDNVQQIYIQENVDNSNIEQLVGSIDSIGAYDIVNDETLTGNNVKVGILEPGIIDEDHVTLENTNTVVRREWYYTETEHVHTTKMAAIIAGTYGIAKDATILSVELSGNASSEVDWLLDQGVDIINMSYGDTTPNGVYSAKSAYMDYIAYTYKITMVSSAGNQGETSSYVSNPGLGYNVITMGACSKYDDGVLSFTSTTVANGPSKPTLTAPGSLIYLRGFNDTNSGTSLSSAITSGALALLMEKFPALKTQPERAIALLAASATKIEGYSNVSGLNQYAGAGKLNITNAINSYNNSLFYVFQNAKADTLPIKRLYLTEGQKIRVALAWFAFANGTVSDTVMTDYDLKFYNATTNALAMSSISSTTNIEFIEYTIPSSGYYRIEVYQYGNRAKEACDYAGISYYIY